MKKVLSGLAAVVAVSLFAGSALADGDVKKGEKVFKRCKACHKVEDGKNGVGPHLFGIVGRHVAGVDGYKYSSAMTEYASGDAVWDEARLTAYLTKPRTRFQAPRWRSPVSRRKRKSPIFSLTWARSSKSRRIRTAVSRGPAPG